MQLLLSINEDDRGKGFTMAEFRRRVFTQYSIYRLYWLYHTDSAPGLSGLLDWHILNYFVDLVVHAVGQMTHFMQRFTQLSTPEMW